METQVGELVHVDVSPLVLHEASDVAKGVVCFGVVLSEKPGARSEGIEQLDGKDRSVFELLGTQWVCLHLAGNGGKETCFFHEFEGLRNRHDHFPPLAPRQKSKEEPAGANPCLFAASGTVNALFRPSKPIHVVWHRAPVFKTQDPHAEPACTVFALHNIEILTVIGTA